MTRRYLFAIVLLIIACAATQGQGQIIETELGKLEIIGLEKETPQQFWDRIYARTPVQGVHACASVLKDEFGYPDASVQLYRDSGDALYWVVTVIEPHDSNRVKYRSAPEKVGENISEWSPMLTIFSEDFETVQDAMLAYSLVASGKRDSALTEITERTEYIRRFSSRDAPNIAVIDSIWTFLMNHRSETDKELALRTLASDGNQKNRVIAAAILANFPDDSRAWHAAVGTLLEKDFMVEAVGKFTLSILRSSGKRQVDWSPAVDPLRRVLNGTNLFAFGQIAKMLVATGVSPSLAAPLLKDNYDLVLAKLKAHHPEERQAAHKLLVKLRGEDPGETSGAWERWLKSL